MSEMKLNATVARAKAMWGKRLRAEDYTEMLNCTSVADVADYLKGTAGYAGVLAGVDPRSVHRGYLESILRQSSVDRILKLCSFQNLQKMPFYDFYVVEGEISALMRFILYLNAGSAASFISTVPSYLVKSASFDVLELARSSTAEQMFEAIRHTPYCEIIKKAGTDENGRINYSKCEIMLRTFYLGNLIDDVKKHFRGRERAELLNQLMLQIDLINIINSYRLKIFYNKSAESIGEQMLPFYSRFGKARQIQLFESKSREDFESVLENSFLGGRLGAADGDFFEQNVRILRVSSAKSALMSARGVAVCLYSISFLFETEVENIITIIEGVRYKRPADTIKKYIVV